FDGSYVQADSILPLRGYWVKVNQRGKLILSPSGSVNPSNRIRLEPSAELPPPPPETRKPTSGSVSPAAFALEQNFPNPFNPTTAIKFVLPSRSIITLKVYDVLGTEVSTLIEEKPSDAGIHSLEFDGEGLGSGIYFYRFIATPFDGSPQFVEMKKMLLLR
ncbi:MAG TPA: T9SS type A sorting domain-containing protein, partial [Bacteroidota bacterium]|nr:T9SS type A sorting domain-containing protein [Bacteroidota bacterium]